MPSRRRDRLPRRSRFQVDADAGARLLAVALGSGLRDARRAGGLRQVDVADRAGLATSTVSAAERGLGDYTLSTWTRLARAAGSDLRAYLERASAAQLPRDIVHLGHQELIARTAQPGGWRPRFEHTIDRDPSRSRSADLLLVRAGELALFEIWDVFDDVGAAMRSWDRKLARIEVAAIARMMPDAVTPAVGGCWVVRATRRNRALVTAHRTLFASRFPAPAARWLAVLGSPDAPMPPEHGLLWISVDGRTLR